MSRKLVDITDYDPINLLTQNEIYLNAVQKASISVYNLGFRPLDSNTIHRKDGLLTAVIPRLDQAPFLDRVDASVHSYIKQKRKQDQSSRMRCSMDPSSDAMKHLAQFQMEHGVRANAEDGEDQPPGTASKRKDKKKALKVNPNEEIRAARPTTRMEKEKEEKRRLEEERKKEEEHKQKISKRFVLVEDGSEMVYDDNGNKVPLHVFEKQRSDKQKEEEQKKKRALEEQLKARKEALHQALTSQKALWMKSSTHVEKARQQAIIQRKEFPYWQPGILPASTITMATEKTALPALLVFQKFPKTGEYDAATHSMVPGDILITIEHCDHCHHHEDFTHHQTQQYEEMAKVVTQALRETAQRYALRFFSLVRGIDEVDALQLSQAQAQKAMKQEENKKTTTSTHHSSNILSLGMGSSYPLNTGKSSGVIDSKDGVAQEERAIEQTLGKLRRSMSFRSYNIAANDFQAVRNEAKVQVLQTQNKHRIGAFEVQVTLCINPTSSSHRSGHINTPQSTPQRPQSAPQSSKSLSQNTPQQQHHVSSTDLPQDQPRQLIQHVLYSKLYHGAWPSIMKLRERLEVLLDSHRVMRIVSGSTVRSSFNSSTSPSKRPDSAPMSNSNPVVMMGTLSQMQHHHEENMRKITEVNRGMRHSHSSGPIPIEQLDIEQELRRRSEEDSAAATQWQEKELKRIKKLEELVPPAFDNRFAVKPTPMKQTGHNKNIPLDAASGENGPPISSPNAQPAQRPSASTTLDNQPQKQTQSYIENDTKNEELQEEKSQQVVMTPSSSKKEHAQAPEMLDSLTNLNDVSLTDADMTDLDDEILKTMRAAESQKHKHDWSEDTVLVSTPVTPIPQTATAVVSSSDKPTSLKNPVSSSYSSPATDGIAKLGRAKSVSFGNLDKLEVEFQNKGENEAKLQSKPASANPSTAAIDEEVSPIKRVSAPRPTIAKPSLRSQPSMKNMDTTDDDVNIEDDANIIEDRPPSGMGSAKSSSLSEHFKQNDTNTLKEALLSIQRMLTKTDSDDSNDHSYFHQDYDDQLDRCDAFADDPFFQKLEHGESKSVLRISVNVGDHHGENEDADLDDFHQHRGGVQVAVTEVPRSPK